MSEAAAETRDNRDIIQGQWQKWRRMSTLEEMWDNRGGDDGYTGIRKRWWWRCGTAGTAIEEIRDDRYGG